MAERDTGIAKAASWGGTAPIGGIPILRHHGSTVLAVWKRKVVMDTRSGGIGIIGVIVIVVVILFLVGVI